MGQYYQILQKQPNLVYQFYNDASTVMRVDGDRTETATTMMVVSINVCVSPMLSIVVLKVFFD